MNKKIGLIIGIVLVVIIGFFIFKKEAATPITTEPIKIGAIYALTGPAAKFGELSVQGVKDAVDYFTETTGQPAAVLVEDSAGDPKVGVSAATKLFTVDKVKFVVAGSSGVSAAIAPIAEQNQGGLISDAALLGLTKDKNYTLQNFMPSLADIPIEINNRAEWKKIAVVYINDEFGNVWQKNIANGVSTTKTAQAFSFEKTATDYRTDAAKIKQFKPDAMVVIGYGPALNQVLADLKTSGLTVPIISYLACTLPGVLTDGRFSLEGQYSYEYPAITNMAIKSWIEKRGRTPNTFYTVPFENTLLALTASKEGGSNVDEGITYLKNNKFVGLWGDVQFGADGVVNRDLILTKVQNGVCVPQ